MEAQQEEMHALENHKHQAECEAAEAMEERDKLEEVVAAQAKRIEELVAEMGAKEQRIADLEGEVDKMNKKKEKKKKNQEEEETKKRQTTDE